MRRFIGVFGLLTMMVITACQRPISKALKTESIKETGNRSFEYLRDRLRLDSESRDKTITDIDVESYFLDGKFDWETKTLHATTEIKFKILKQATTLELDFHVAKIHSIEDANGKELSFTSPSAGRIQIDVSQFLPAGPVYSLFVKYDVLANTAPSGESSALIATLPRKGDPNPSRTLATFSEPLGAKEWLPCHNVPKDRAKFGARFTMPAQETLIANGDLVKNEVRDGVRTMEYRTRYSLPNYLMAFAIGEFQTHTQYHHGLPVSVWARRGVPGDYSRVVNDLVRIISTYERLLVPYPFEKYSLVLLPNYTGGLEHAGITFQGETTSTQSLNAHDFGLSAHELGHQWFGDLMTISGWDDLWIKEGMATLLSEEATRHFEDQGKSGRLFGLNENVEEGDAVIDPKLEPDQKYTTGPYGRAAWVYTQLRSHLGEDRFWATLRKVLNENRFGSMSTEKYFDYFKPHLSKQAFESFKTALYAHALPTLHAAKEKDGSHTLSLEDKEKTLIEPLELGWLDARGNLETKIMYDGSKVEIAANEERLMLFERDDRHPVLEFVPNSEREKMHDIFKYLVPRNDASLAHFVKLAPQHHKMAFSNEKLWSMNPQQFEKLYRGIQSEEVKYTLLQMGCTSGVNGKAEEKDLWKKSLTVTLIHPPYLGMPLQTSGTALSYCRHLVGDSLFEERVNQLIRFPNDPTFSEFEILYLTLLSTSAERAFELAKGLVEMGPSVRTQGAALKLLVRHLKGSGKHTSPTEKTLTDWKIFLRGLLLSHEASETTGVVFEALEAAKDVDAIPTITTYLTKSHPARSNRGAVCLGHKLIGDNAEAWKRFQTSLGSLENFPPSIRKLIEEPKHCDDHE